MMGICSSIAQDISHRAPSAPAVFELSRAITPSDSLMIDRQRVFHFSSNGSLIDMSVKEKGVVSLRACPTRYSLAHLSSIAKLTNTRLLRAVVLLDCRLPLGPVADGPRLNCFSKSAARFSRPARNWAGVRRLRSAAL